MLKKALFVTVGVAILGVVMFGSNIMYMAQDFFVGARSFGDRMISIERKIEHVSRDIASLDKDKLNLMHDIAKEERSCEKLKKEVVAKNRMLTELHAHMEVLNTHLKTTPSQMFVGTDGENYSASQVKKDLASSLRKYKTQRGMLTALEKQLNSRVEIVSKAKDSLNELQRIQAEMKSELEALKAEHKMNEVAKMTSEIKLDNSRLNRAKAALEKLESEIRVESNVLNQSENAGQIPTQPQESDDLGNVTAQYEAFFGKTTGVATK